MTQIIEITHWNNHWYCDAVLDNGSRVRIDPIELPVDRLEVKR